MGRNSDYERMKAGSGSCIQQQVLRFFLAASSFILLLFLIPEESTLLTLASYEYGFLQTVALEENENSPSQGFREKYNGLGFV